MAFKMKNTSVAKMVKMAGNNRTAMKMKAEEKAAMKMKKAAMTKAHEDAAMKKAHEAAMKLKKESAMKAAKPDFPDIDGDGNTSESMKKAAADKKSAAKMKKHMKMKKESSMKMGHKSPAKLKKESPAKMGHSPKKMKKSAMKNMGAGHDEDHRKGGKHQGSDTSTIIFPRNIIRGSINNQEREKAKKRKAAKNAPTKMKKAAMKMGHKKK